MIDKILDVMFWFIKGVIDLLPSWSLGHNDSLVTLATTINTIGQYFPITDLFQIIGLYLIYYGMAVWVRPLMSLARLR